MDAVFMLLNKASEWFKAWVCYHHGDVSVHFRVSIWSQLANTVDVLEMQNDTR